MERRRLLGFGVFTWLRRIRDGRSRVFPKNPHSGLRNSAPTHVSDWRFREDVVNVGCFRSARGSAGKFRLRLARALPSTSNQDEVEECAHRRLSALTICGSHADVRAQRCSSCRNGVKSLPGSAIHTSVAERENVLVQTMKLFQTERCKCGHLKQCDRSCKRCNDALTRQRAQEAERRREARAQRNINPFSQ